MTFQQFKKIVAFYARFTVSFTQIGYAGRRLSWPPVRLDFAGQRWLVTGASGGIGREISLSAARAGATVIVAARSQAKLERLVADAAAMGISGVQTEVCDFSLQADVARLARRIADSGAKLDVLVNNVGVLNDDHSLTSEGRETSYVINLLSHYLLTETLVRRGAFSSRQPLVINMTSGGGYNVPLSTVMLNMTDPAKFNGTGAYGFAKRAQMVLTQYWRDKYGAQRITFYVMHPGWSDTDGVKRSLPRFRRILKSVLRTPASAADTALWLAATRPAQAGRDVLWFDRKARTTHVYPRTRATKDTPESLVAFLENDLARFPDSTP
jgi:dehydrogenase/reductase SDR family protein 12